MRITNDMKIDLDMWKKFFSDYNGISVFHDRFWVSNEDVQLFTDSAGGSDLGFGIYFQGQWACDQWPQNWCNAGITENITFLELFPIVVALYIW